MIETPEELRDWRKWTRLAATEQEVIASAIGAKLADDFDFLRVTAYTGYETVLRVAEFHHRELGQTFHLIPGGSFVMGLSLQEQLTAERLLGEPLMEADQMRPCHERVVRPFLITRNPLPRSAIERYIDLDPAVIRLYDEGEGTVPCSLTRWEATDLASKSRLSLPSEAQWEYMCRATTTTLFCIGNEIPDDDEIENSLCRFVLDEATDGANAFGMVGLGVGEWCADCFHPSYSDATDDLPVKTEDCREFVIRGGAAAYWPWQGCDEWILSMTAYRSSSQWLDTGPEPLAATRLVRQLN